MLLWLAIVAGPTSAEVEAAMRRVVEAGSYQTVLPGREQADLAEPADEPPPEDELDSPPSRPSREQAVIGQAVIWVLVAVAAVLVIAWIVVAVRQRGSRKEAEAAPADAEAPATVPPLADPEALARAGAWTEAAHATLLLVIADINHRGLSPAWTSREILRRAKLPPVARQPLQDLVLLVERCLFGGATATQADYARARERGLACRKALAS